MIISSNIKKYRELKDMTQENLAEQMNISRQSISKWERGDALPSVENLIRLSELLDLSLDDLVLNQSEFPLPFDYGTFKSKWVYFGWMFMPIFFIVNGLFALSYAGEGWYYVFGGLLMGGLIQETAMVDLKRYYNYFTVTKTGISYYSSKYYIPKPVKIILGVFGLRHVEFVSYKDIEEMQIYFGNNGFQGFNTTVSYRPRQYFYNREIFELRLTLKDGQKVHLNLDRAFFSDSLERRYFLAMFNYFKGQNIPLEDKYNVINSIEKEYSIIDEAYKLKEGF